MNLEINLKEKINEKQNAYPSVGGSLPLGAIGRWPIRCLPPRRWTRPWQTCFLLLSLLGIMAMMTACFGNKAPARSYYSIDYTLGSQPKYDKPRHQKSIVVSNITTINAYDRQEIVYRTNPYEFQYYWYRLWASKPRKMLRELIAQHLRYTQIVSDVTFFVEERLPDYTLETEIIAIEELDVTKTEWYAHLALRMTLLCFETGMAVWSYDFDVKYPVAAQEPVFVVKTMSELVDKELTKAFTSMDKRLVELVEEKPETTSELNAEIAKDERAALKSKKQPTLGEQSARAAEEKETTEEESKGAEKEAEVEVNEPRARLRNRR